MEYNGSSALAHVPCLIIRKHKWLEYNSISLIKCRCLSTSLLTVFKNSFLFFKTEKNKKAYLTIKIYFFILYS